MSRAFVKETDDDNADELPERAPSPHTNYVTPAGLELLQQRVGELTAQKERLASDDDMAARQQLKQVNRDLRYYEERLNQAVLVQPDPHGNGKVHFGAAVKVRDAQGQTECFSIVGEDEADAAQGKISWISPLAVALMDAEVGDIVTWKRPAGDKDMEVLSIHSGSGTC